MPYYGITIRKHQGWLPGKGSSHTQCQVSLGRLGTTQFASSVRIVSSAVLPVFLLLQFCCYFRPSARQMFAESIKKSPVLVLYFIWSFLNNVSGGTFITQKNWRASLMDGIEDTKWIRKHSKIAYLCQVCTTLLIYYSIYRQCLEMCHTDYLMAHINLGGYLKILSGDIRAL